MLLTLQLGVASWFVDHIVFYLEREVIGAVHQLVVHFFTARGPSGAFHCQLNIPGAPFFPHYTEGPQIVREWSLLAGISISLTSVVLPRINC